MCESGRLGFDIIIIFELAVVDVKLKMICIEKLIYLFAILLVDKGHDLFMSWFSHPFQHHIKRCLHDLLDHIFEIVESF
jgi:hypothetical protein